MRCRNRALVRAARFAGSALYITLVEHPAGLTLPHGPLLAQWRVSYKRALPIQARLAVLGGLAGLVAWYGLRDWGLLASGPVLLANWPWTILVIMPITKRLMVRSEAEGGRGAGGCWSGGVGCTSCGAGLGAAVLLLAWGGGVRRLPDQPASGETNGFIRTFAALYS